MPINDDPNPDGHAPEAWPAASPAGVSAEDADAPASETPMPRDGTATDAYTVGRNRPPREWQFKPGRSGNPRGRPKSAKNFTTIVREVLGEKVVVTRKGKRKTVTVLEAILQRTAVDAVQGNARARQQVVEIAARAGLIEEAAAATGLPPLTPEGEADLAAFLARHAPALLADEAEISAATPNTPPEEDDR